MHCQYAIINRKFICTDQIQFNFEQAETFFRSRRIVVPIIHAQTFLFKEIVAETNIQPYPPQYQRDIKEQLPQLISKNRLFIDGYAELIIHKDLDTKQHDSYSILLNQGESLSEYRQGKTLSIQNGYSNYHRFGKKERSTHDSCIACYSLDNGIFPLSQAGSLVSIKGNNCYIAPGDSLDMQPIINTFATILNKNGLQPHKTKLSLADIYDSDEILFVNNQNVIDWIKGYKNKRFFCRKFKMAVKSLREILNGTA